MLGLIAFGALTIGGAGHAHANVFSGYAGDHDQYAMWEDVLDFAPSVSASTAGQFAQRVCGMLDSGTSEGQLVNEAVTQYGVSALAARYIMHAAEFHYCPTYYGVTSGETV